MGYADTYASNHAAILRDLGRSQAEAKLRAGAGWANAIGEIGQIAGNLPGQLADERRSKQQEALWQANLDDFMQKRQENQWLKDAMNSSMTPDGQFDPRRLTENLQMLGAAELVPQALDVLNKQKQATLELRHAEAQGNMDQLQLASLRRAVVAPHIKGLLDSQANPALLEASLAALRIDAPEIADALEQEIAKNPAAAIKQYVESFLEPPAPDKPVVVGNALVTPQGEELYRNPGEEKPQTVEQMIAAALKAGDREEVNRLIKFKGQEAAATRAPNQGPAANYQRIETVDASGNPVIQFMTPEEVRAQGGIKTSPKTTAKATGPAAVDAVLGEIEDLSKKINTVASGPGANVQGMVRRGASALNMDNEVSEYQRLVEGFIPIMARSVGHTGVLTQMDVDSTKALFPRVGDNSTLSSNLIARVKRIMSALQDPSVQALGPDASFSQKMNAAMAIAGKAGAPARGGGAGPAKGAADPLGIRKGGG